jgi:hypothetical protein
LCDLAGGHIGHWIAGMLREPPFAVEVIISISPVSMKRLLPAQRRTRGEIAAEETDQNAQFSTGVDMSSQFWHRRVLLTVFTFSVDGRQQVLAQLPS